MNHVELFAGVGGIGLGLGAVGVPTVAWSEVEKHACAVMRHNHPDAVELGSVIDLDPRALDRWCPDDTIVTAGTPCSDLSIANTTRSGLSGEKSRLFYEYVRIIDGYRPAWTVWENVPGAFTSNGGRDFGTVIRSLADVGYVLAWRVMDLQNFGVAQRRRRVFVVARRADAPGPDPCQVLDLCPGCARHSDSGVTTGPDPAGASADGAEGSGIGFRASAFAQYALGIGPLTRRYEKDGKEGLVVFVKGRRAMNPQDHETWVERDVSCTLNQFDASPARATVLVASALTRNGLGGGGPDDNLAQGNHLVPCETGVRRLMPVECERLMGWPDGWTAHGVKTDGSTYELSDSPRYKLVGNGVGSPVVEWIGRRLVADRTTPPAIEFGEQMEMFR